MPQREDASRGQTPGVEVDTFTDGKQDSFPRTGWLAGRNMKDLVSGEKVRGQSDAAGLGELMTMSNSERK